MKYGYLIHRRTDSIVIGTYEMVPGCATLEFVTQAEDGTLDHQYGGGTEIYWNDQHTQYNKFGETLYVTDRGDIVPAGQCEFVENRDDPQ